MLTSFPFEITVLTVNGDISSRRSTHPELIKDTISVCDPLIVASVKLEELLRYWIAQKLR